MNNVWKHVLSISLGLTLMSSLTFSYGTIDQSQILKENDKNVEVFELQRALYELGHFKVADFSNLYGKQTKEAVASFQKSQHMTADGVSGKTTLKLLRDHQLNQRRLGVLKEGVSSPRVALLKSDLIELGYLKSGSGNTFDAATAKALKAFQTQLGVKADGMAGDGTLEKLTDALAKKRGYSGNTASAKAVQTKTAAKAQAAPVKTETKAQAAPAAKESTKPVTRGGEAVRKSKEFLGIAYRYGGSSSKGFDCSGFTVYIMKQYGISLPHSATAQYAHGKAVAKSELKEGDLVFFKTTDQPISHVGIYIGNGNFIHASSAKNKVIISNLKTYGGKYVGARRVL